jgi:hypothetical protein
MATGPGSHAGMEGSAQGRDVVRANPPFNPTHATPPHPALLTQGGMRFCVVLICEAGEASVSDDVKTAVQSWSAETQMRAVQDYVSRGRRLEHSPEVALAAAWISLRRARATSTRQLQDTRLKDIEAEMPSIPSPPRQRAHSLRCLPAVLLSMRWPSHRPLGPAEDWRLMLRAVSRLERLADRRPLGLGCSAPFGLLLLWLLRFPMTVLLAVCHGIALQAFRIISHQRIPTTRAYHSVPLLTQAAMRYR